MQNHTVIYYDALSATMLNKLWADPFNPDRKAVSFPEGGMVVKAAAVTPTPRTVAGARRRGDLERIPSAGRGARRARLQSVHQRRAPRSLPLRVLQFDIIVKDSTASPQTGWVFVTYVYEKDAPGETTWDKLVPLGAMWGNDPAFAREPDGKDPNGGPLQETWINPARRPTPSRRSAGEGGCRVRSTSRNATTCCSTDGTRVPEMHASSCLSCHGTAQFPFVANLYPSPNRTFPPEGTLFPMYPPGSEMWSRWFQNRPGSLPRTTTRDRSRSTTTCSSCSRSAPSTPRPATTSTSKTMSTSTREPSDRLDQLIAGVAGAGTGPRRRSTAS